MKLLNEFTWGSMYKEEEFTIKDSLEKIQNDISLKMNTTFQILSKQINVNIKNRGRTFSISTFENNDPSRSKMVDTFRKIEDPQKLAALVADFSMEKMDSFEKDEDYSIKVFLSNLEQDVKDDLLFNYLKKAGKEKEEFNMAVEAN